MANPAASGDPARDGGADYQPIGSMLPVTTTSMRLSGLAAGSHMLIVKMIGQPSILNQVSPAVAFSQ